MQLGVIGLGRMGANIVRRLLQNKHECIVFNRTPDKAKQLASEGAIAAYTLWSYARGSGLSKVGETAIDVIGYAAQIAAQLGAHIIKVKLPNEHVEQEAARKVYEKEQIPTIATLTERVHHVVQCAFNGRRIVIFSGGPIDSDDAFFNEVRAIQAGGGFGSIVRRNSFQRSKQDAMHFLETIIDIYNTQPSQVQVPVLN